MMKLDVEMNAMTSGGPQSFTLIRQQIDGPDYRTVSKHIDDKSYLQLYDFDDHFENVNNDWRNPDLFE